MSAQGGAGPQGVMRVSHWGETFQGIPFRIVLDDHAFDRGGSAGIYKGEIQGPPSRDPLVVAVKVAGVLGAAQKGLLERELMIAQKLRHPSILPYLGTVDCGGEQRAIVSRYMPNGNLMQYLKAHQGCDKKKLILQVADAVNYLHNAEHLVHGDLKCANVLVSETCDALLADFGLSTFAEKSQSAAATISAIRAMNTVRFAAPEILSGEDNALISKTRESDVYAFAMLVLEAITEHHPWPKQSDVSVVQRVCAGQQHPRPMSHGFVLFSHSWWDICLRCWRFEPGDRPRMNEILVSLTDTELVPNRAYTDHASYASSITYMAGGSRIVAGFADGTILVWDIATNDIVLALAHSRSVYCVIVSPDGTQIASSGTDGTIRRWDAVSGAPIGAPMKGHRGDVWSVAYSRNGAYMVSGGHDRTVRRWDAESGAAFGSPLKGHEHDVVAVAFSPDSSCIASGSWDATVRLWDSTTGTPRATLPTHPVHSLCFAPRGRLRVASGGGCAALTWDVSAARLEHTLEGHSDDVRCVAFSPNGKFIASGSHDHTVRIWDAETGEPVGMPLAGHGDRVMAVAFSPDGRSLVSGSVDKSIRIWDLFE